MKEWKANPRQVLEAKASTWGASHNQITQLGGAQAKEMAAAALGTFAVHLSEEQRFHRRGVWREFTPVNLIPTREELEQNWNRTAAWEKK